MSDHPFPNLSVEDRGHGAGISHIATPDGKWIAVQHNLPQEFTDAVLDEWWRVWEDHGAV